MKTIIPSLYVLATILLTVPASAVPGMVDVIIPQHIQGASVGGSNFRRVPCAFRVRFTNLTANATYRFINQVVLAGEGATVNGAGNPIFVNTAGNFYGTSSPDLGIAGRYGEFVTDANGQAELWMITEPTGNTRFTPGNTIYMRVRINDGANGTTVANRFTTTSGLLVQDLSTAANSYTAIRGTAVGVPRDFVFLYDNEAGTGRPISGTLMESDGFTVATTYATFYRNNVDGQDNNWGSVIPNNNPNGVRRVERRSLLTADIVAYSTDSDGVWPSGADTVYPSSGETPIVLTPTDAPLPEPALAALTAIAGFCMLRKRS